MSAATDHYWAWPKRIGPRPPAKYPPVNEANARARAAEGAFPEREPSGDEALAKWDKHEEPAS